MLILQQTAEPLPPAGSDPLSAGVAGYDEDHEASSLALSFHFDHDGLALFLDENDNGPKTVCRSRCGHSEQRSACALDFKGLLPFAHINEFVSVRRCIN